MNSVATDSASCLVPFLALSTALATTLAARDDASASASASASTVVARDEPITLENFERHPRIQEVHDLVESVDGDDQLFLVHRDVIAPGRLRRLREKATDEAGRVRLVADQRGTGQTEFYFDRAGTLRFIQETEVAWMAPGKQTYRHSRVYFDAAGARMFEVVRAPARHAPLALPDRDGPTFAVTFDPQIATDPTGYFDAPAAPMRERVSA